MAADIQNQQHQRPTSYMLAAKLQLQSLRAAAASPTCARVRWCRHINTPAGMQAGKARRHGTARHGTARHGTARHGTAQQCMHAHTAARRRRRRGVCGGIWRSRRRARSWRPKTNAHVFWRTRWQPQSHLRRAHARTDAHTYACSHIYTYAHTFTHAYAATHSRSCTRKYARTRARMHACTHTLTHFALVLPSLFRVVV